MCDFQTSVGKSDQIRRKAVSYYIMVDVFKIKAVEKLLIHSSDNYQRAFASIIHHNMLSQLNPSTSEDVNYMVGSASKQK